MEQSQVFNMREKKKQFNSASSDEKEIENYIVYRRWKNMLKTKGKV